MAITCKEAVDFISKKEEGKLSFRQRLQLRYHLFVCSLCRLFYKQNKNMIRALKNDKPVQTLTMAQSDKDALIKMMNDLDK